MSSLQPDFRDLEGAGEIEPIDEDEIIDVDSMDLEDNDRWLCDSNQFSSESRVYDLYAWLKSDPILEDQEHSNTLKKSIDTRTFTRAKRRSNRFSFNAIMETLSSPVKNSVEELKTSGQFPMEEATTSRFQEIPSMLRPKIFSFSGLNGGESQPSSLNRESLEAFLNLSQSKGIDSFINLTEPEFADCIMNESQPSLLYSSVISAADESKRNNTFSDTDSGILTESMMQTSMFQESMNINSFTEIYSKDEDSLQKNLTHTLDQTKVNMSPFNQTKICASPLERTFVNEDHLQETLGLQVNSLNSTNHEDVRKPNETSPILHWNGSYKFNQSLASLPPDFTNPKFDTSTPEEGKLSPSKTFESLNTIRINENSMESALIDADMTFNVKRLSCQGNVSEKPPPNSHVSNITRNPNINNNNQKTNASSLRQELLEEVERSGRKMDSTFSQEKIHQRDLTITYENSKETFAAPMDYYKTFTKESSKKFTQLQIDKQQDLDDEIGDKRFQTFRKSSRKEERESINSTFLKNEVAGNVNSTFAKNEEVEDVNATFSKNENGGKGEQINATFSKEEHGSEEEIVNATFCKPSRLQNVNNTFSKPQPRKLVVPKNLSKLPHYLQKSNPNIPTSNALRVIRAPGSFAYAKGSHPNIPRAVDRMYGLGKYKSDSEQRLSEAIRNSSEQIGNAGGSTESIESTQSAPDLDDRLSVCSDSSRSSYTISTTARTIVSQKDIVNSRTIHKLMPRGLKPESTPKPNRQILENTWVQAENDLPSPILKNHIQCPKRNNISPHSDLKSSSPFFSPSSSNENINSLGVVENHSRGFKKPKEIEKVAAKASHAPSNRVKSTVELKPRLRPPTNYNSARPPNTASGIPRPASRIPAPKFSRPLSRIQDQKKG